MEMADSQKYQELRNKTLPGIFLERVKNTPNEVAYRVKKLGVYKERTWSEFHRMVACCAMGLTQLGLKYGDCLALMGDPCEEYVICELAAQALGAVTFGIYPTSSPKDLLYLMNDGRASILIAENQEYVDRVLPFFDELSHLRHIVSIDTKGLFMYEHLSLISYEKVLKIGEEQLDSTPGAFEEMANRIKPSDGSFIVYTSGTTANPKGVLISHGKHLSSTYTLIDRYPLLAEIPHRTVVYLPLCQVFGKTVAITLPLLAPIVPHYGEDIEDLGKTFFEIAPTVLFTVPRYLKKYASGILVSIENSSPLKKLIYRMAFKIGQHHMKKVWGGRKSLLLGLAYFVSYQTIFRPILNKIGFDKLKIALSTGTPLPPELMALWQIYGVNLSEMYGLTETGGGIVSGQGLNFPRPGNVGIPSVCWEVRLSESGEILIRGNEMFEYYWNNPKLNNEILDDNGWFHTGDAGEWTLDGNLRIVGRIQDFITTPDGKRLSPMSVENFLRSNPYISEAVVFGHNRKYLCSLIEVDFETVSDWANRNNIPFTGFTSLIQHPEVIKFIGEEMEKINKNLAPEEQIKSFRIIPKEMTPSENGGPVTTTRKIKRQLMYEMFRELVESMYDDG